MRIIKNTTKYDTRNISNVIVEAHKLISVRRGKLPQWKFVEVTIRNRKNRTSGHAYLKGTKTVLSLPPNATTRQLFQLAWHELMHLYGYVHSQYPTYPYDDDVKEYCAKFSELLPMQEKKINDKNIKEIRLAKIQARIKAWETKEKRAKTALRKLRQAEKRYIKTIYEK